MKSLGLQTIAIDKVNDAFRLRKIDPAWAQALAENIQETGGLRSPIEVRAAKNGGFDLIAGGHRLAAAKLLGWTEIDALVFQTSADEARLREIDENLVRHELNPLDRAVFLAERKALYEKLHPETKHGGDRRSDAAKNQDETISFWSFTRDTAERIGLTDRTIQLAVRIATGLAPDVKASIAGTPIAKSQVDLLALAALGPVEQRAVVAELLPQYPDAPQTVREVIARLRGQVARVASPFDKLVTAWRHASTAERAQFVLFLETMGLVVPPPAPESAEAGADAASDDDTSDNPDDGSEA